MLAHPAAKNVGAHMSKKARQILVEENMMRQSGMAAALSVKEMYAADRFAIAAGVASPVLMEAAGAAVARAILRRWKARPVTILCGPGNNGGDGFVIARHLHGAGWPVRLALLGDAKALKGDAAWAADGWTGGVEPLGTEALDGAGLIVDALFGAGLDRPIEGVAAAVLNAAADSNVPTVAVDVPSGLAGDTGQVLGTVAPADLTVTFFRKKPAHLLLPGRTLCGEIRVADIGIPEAALEAIAPATWENDPAVWPEALKAPRLDGHKYRRGHVLVAAGAMPGAARLAATAALRGGAGLSTIVCKPGEEAICGAGIPLAVILRTAASPAAFAETAIAVKATSLVAGPGLGAGARGLVSAAAGTGLPAVIDADGLSAFADSPSELFDAVQGRAVLTPHDGEYARLFDQDGDRLRRARFAARESGCVVLLKGGDTAIAAPDGRAAININAPAWLATAGAGDVLAGMIAALLGQGVPHFEAACAAAWLHGAAAALAGPGLIADDLLNAIAPVIPPGFVK
jgi:hydroxyethylthiazole kinase-like uncharacterized protein yjeF